MFFQDVYIPCSFGRIGWPHFLNFLKFFSFEKLFIFFDLLEDLGVHIF